VWFDYTALKGQRSWLNLPYLDNLTVAKDFSMMHRSSFFLVWGHGPLLSFAYTTELVVVKSQGCWNTAGKNA